MFAERLKELRIKNGMTQGELARLTGLSSSAIGMYEQSRREPDSHTLKKLGEVFSVPVDYLLGAEKQSAPKNIEEAIEGFRESLKNSEGLMFKGVPLSERDIEKLTDAIELSARIVLSSELRENGVERNGKN